jgi:transposase
MPGKAAKVVVTEKQQEILKEYTASRSVSVSLAQRSRIILLAFDRLNNEAIEREVGLGHDQVGLWRRRWRDNWNRLIGIECAEDLHELKNAIKELLADAHRSGRPPEISSEQQAELIATACENPQDSGRPIACWTSDELADEMTTRGTFLTISGRWVRQLLARMKIRPHRIKYWLFSKDKKRDPRFDERVASLCDAYRDAIPLYEQEGVHTICLDEMTGIQALERIAPDLAVAPGLTARLEYEYKRNGTIGLFGNLHVATGKIWCPMLRETRTEEDTLENLDNVIQQDPTARFRLVMDNLNTHASESFVRYIAYLIGYEEDLGKKGVRGILKSVASRCEFLTDPTHRVQLIFTPRHCSWLNQIEMWFGTLGRKVTRRMSFDSVESLSNMILRFIDYYNANLAHPYNWTYTGRVLAA